MFETTNQPTPDLDSARARVKLWRNLSILAIAVVVVCLVADFFFLPTNDVALSISVGIRALLVCALVGGVASFIARRRAEALLRRLHYAD